MLENIIKYGISVADGKCTLCTSSVLLNEIPSHVENELHVAREKEHTGKNVYSLEEIDKEALQILIDNKILIVGYKQYVCVICNCYVSCLLNVFQHVKGKFHKSKINANMNEKKNDVVIQTMVFVGNEMNSIANVMNKLNIGNESNGLIIPDDVQHDIEETFKALKKHQKLEEKEEKERTYILQYFNEAYDVNVFDLEQKIFVVNEEDIDELKLNYQLSYGCKVKKVTGRYCILCEKFFEYFHEHLCSNVHIEKLKTFDLTFLNTCMKAERNSMYCYPCMKHINYDLYSEHTESNVHTEALVKWRHKNHSDMITFLCEWEDLWYSIQNYCCTICSKKFEFKISFIEHIKNHPEFLSKNITQYFGFCKPCAMIWLSGNNMGIHSIHCNDKIHKYLVNRKIYSVPELPDCVKYLLQNAKDTAIQLYKSATELLTQKTHKEKGICSLENLLAKEFPNVKVYQYGSRFTGLQFADSDVDIYIDYNGNSYYQNTSVNSQKIVESIEKCIERENETWEIKEILKTSRTPIIRMIHRLTGINFDISFTTGLCVENSKLIRYLVMSYPILHKLILFLKKWLYLCDLPGLNCISNYALVWLVVFYFQNRSELIVPSVIEIINKKKCKNISHWRIPVLPVTYIAPAANSSVNSDLEFITHLIKFFKFYAKFDYRLDVVCPLLGHTVKKRSFAEVTTLPKGMTSYAKQLSSKDPEYFRIDSPMCVQDPYNLSDNLTKAVTTFTLKCFRQFCQRSAENVKAKYHYLCASN